MKAKYFPKANFMSAKLGSYPSYTWHSIWGARQLLKEGMGWQIGNGDSINIWNDSWLPGPGSGRIRCQNMDIRFTQVSETNTWKQDIIQSIFDEEQLNKERLQMANYRGGTRIHNEIPTNFFTKLWELQVPSKIRILMWRIANNYLPTLHNLKVRQLAVNPLCLVCQSEEESLDHLFRDCSFTQQVLRGLEKSFSTYNR
ncbi:hypothetical protein CXB51_025112 [Gossypium anomalum]|uniref:Reverse transcriptase zinc-binding domain-containing protein n=1 Tax=Gossypium anomalum TaxID=47600 RepID=A0A8J5YAL2_9ROSI|nr:hypothetical protein CXB51_025112 [Gossypium anomalum]